MSQTLSPSSLVAQARRQEERGPARAIAPQPGLFGVPSSTFVKVAILSVLFALTFWPSLRRLWLKTNPFFGEPNWSHSICIPIVGLYYLYLHREELARTPAVPLGIRPYTRRRFFIVGWMCLVAGALIVLAPHLVPLLGKVLAKIGMGSTVGMEAVFQVVGWATIALAVLSAFFNWGLGTLLFGLGTYAYGIFPGQNDPVKDVGLVVALFGVTLMLCGWRVMRFAWFPIAFLICGIPWPGLLYSKVAGPLQTLAATVAVFVMQLTGVDAQQIGTKIFIAAARAGEPGRTLNVAEACAGMRSLMTFITVATTIAFLSNRPLWQKIIIAVSGIPIAIACNVARVTGQGLLDRYVSQEWSEGFAHTFAGMIMLLPAFFLVLMVGWVLDRMFVEEIDPSVVARKQPGVLTRGGAATAMAAPAPAASARRSTAARLIAATTTQPVVPTSAVAAPNEAPETAPRRRHLTSPPPPPNDATPKGAR